LNLDAILALPNIETETIVMKDNNLVSIKNQPECLAEKSHYPK